jgi:hypothetical protein
LLSVFAWLTNLFGGGFFWIKFWPSLFGALNYLIVGSLVVYCRGVDGGSPDPPGAAGVGSRQGVLHFGCLSRFIWFRRCRTGTLDGKTLSVAPFCDGWGNACGRLWVHLPQDFADMLSWKEMTQKVAAAYATLDAKEKSQTLLFCDNYGQAGALNYYGPQYGLPPAYSDNASFLYWMPENYPYNVLLLVTDDQQEMQHPFIREFASAKVMDSITNPYAREYGSLILLLKAPSPGFRKAFIDKIDKKRFKTTATGVSGPGASPNALEEGGPLH